MNVLAPRVVGPLSECSRSVTIANAIPDATVSVVVARAGAEIHAGQKTVKNSKDVIPLSAGFDLVAGDIVNAMQELAGDRSSVSNDGQKCSGASRNSTRSRRSLICISARADSRSAECVPARACRCWKTAL